MHLGIACPECGQPQARVLDRLGDALAFAGLYAAWSEANEAWGRYEALCDEQKRMLNDTKKTIDLIRRELA